MPKESLKKCTIAVTGSFGPDKDIHKVKQWIEGSGGKYIAKVEEGVTHLVCSQESFKKKSPIVAAASKIKGLKIVSFDWLEDSLQKRSKQRVTSYLLQSQAKKVERKEKKQAARRESLLTGLSGFEDGCQDIRDQMNREGYHIYREPISGFAYDVTLVRSDLLEKKKTSNVDERWVLKVGQILNPLWPSYTPRQTCVPLGKPRTQCLQLYESGNEKRRTYATYATYSTSDGKSATHVCAPAGTKFPVAMDHFKAFFKLKTKRKWHERNAIEKMNARFQYSMKSDDPLGDEGGKEKPQKEAQEPQEAQKEDPEEIEW